MRQTQDDYCDKICDEHPLASPDIQYPAPNSQSRCTTLIIRDSLREVVLKFNLPVVFLGH